MKPPCEIVVWYVIPAIRSELAKDLLALGMKQKDSRAYGYNSACCVSVYY